MLTNIASAMRLQAVSAKNDALPSSVNDTPVVSQRLMQDTFTPIATKQREGNNRAIFLQNKLDTLLAIEAKQLTNETIANFLGFPFPALTSEQKIQSLQHMEEKFKSIGSDLSKYSSAQLKLLFKINELRQELGG